MPGTSEFSHEWSGATWHFASAENRDAFAADPEQYAAQYGGVWAWAVSEVYSAAVDPEAWKIVDGKLYLNFNADIHSRWEKKQASYIKRSEKKWPSLSK